MIPLFITNLLDGRKVPLYGDGLNQRDWLYVEDNCRGVLAVLERGQVGEVYNLGGLEIEENLTIARRLLGILDQPETLISHVQDRPGHDRRYALNCEKVERELGWKPTMTLGEGLRQTIDWYKRSADWVEAVRGGGYRSYYEKYYENRDRSLDAIARSSSRAPR